MLHRRCQEMQQQDDNGDNYNSKPQSVETGRWGRDWVCMAVDRIQREKVEYSMFDPGILIDRGTPTYTPPVDFRSLFRLMFLCWVYTPLDSKHYKPLSCFYKSYTREVGLDGCF